ncbi:cytidine deaminase-like protein [Gigaspora rosea]|uniref:Cytidine deaminase-like protein n=1 Tax=Gigaspora rosea TaxID=44941 RepID=A0A397UG74_9GLOM|nr:cytidine deaminase-like protein [Gigaspora rosea]
MVVFLYKELKAALNLPAAASFKHGSPAGMYFMDDLKKPTPFANAYARAREINLSSVIRMPSFGNWIALSDIVGVPTAKLFRTRYYHISVSDDVIAPGYDAQALENFKQKEGWKIHCNSEIESRQLSNSAITGLIVASIVLKYTQSNSVCYAKNDMVIGLGAGQQSRIHLIAFDFKKSARRAEKSNAIDLYVLDKIGEGLERNIHWAHQSGADYVVAPSGSVQDQAAIQAADEHGMVLIHTNLRLFHH